MRISNRNIMSRKENYMMSFVLLVIFLFLKKHLHTHTHARLVWTKMLKKFIMFIFAWLTT